MKKIFTFCFFAFALILGTQSMEAQNSTDINQKASAKAKELRNQLKFHDDSLEDVYQAYRAFESKTQTINSTNKVGSKEYNENMTIVKGNLLEKMETILTSAQYKRFIILLEKDMNKSK